MVYTTLIAVVITVQKGRLGMLFTSVGPFLVAVYVIIDIILTIQIAAAAKKWGGPTAGYIVVGLLFSFVPILVSLVCRVASKLAISSDAQTQLTAPSVNPSTAAPTEGGEVGGIVVKEDLQEGTE